MKVYKKNIRLVAIFTLVSSCASLDVNNIAPSYVAAYSSIKGVIFGYEDINITRDLVSSIPYASAKIKIGKGSSGLLILESIEDNLATWVSADKVIFLINDGRIIRTQGLINNLTSYQSVDQSFKDLLYNPNPVLNYYSYYSYDEPLLYNLKVEVSLSVKESEDIEILGEVRSLILVEELVTSKKINWTKKNKYWVDPDTFFVWKSIQYISPKLPRVDFEVTKKPA
ncbi:YjbF family lipoprotein [bacterium]|nr:YjbF family lipoprotein [bacterium]